MNLSCHFFIVTTDLRFLLVIEANYFKIFYGYKTFGFQGLYQIPIDPLVKLFASSSSKDE
tara:strand:- start:675 stop:854 length:180 start_codon:yes stop_codon:yes gene_type:complete